MVLKTNALTVFFPHNWAIVIIALPTTCLANNCKQNQNRNTLLSSKKQTQVENVWCIEKTKLKNSIIK